MTGRMYNPFDHKFGKVRPGWRQDGWAKPPKFGKEPDATMPQNGTETALRATNSPPADATTLRDASNGPSRASNGQLPETRIEAVPDTGHKRGEWFIYLIGWMKR